MAFDKTTLGLYHTFSKTPVDQDTGSAAAQLGNAINKSGHTVQSSEVWAEAIPFYGKAGKVELAHKNLSATANTNDLVQVGEVLYQRNSTPAVFDASGALTSTFNELWFVKTKSITSTIKDENGEYPTVDGALVDGSYLVNAEGKPVIRYYKDRLLTPLIDDNNANTHSQGWASRLKVDGRWVEQFVGATDSYVNGNAAVMYSPVVYRKKGDAKPLDAGSGNDYMDYCATGIILWDKKKTNISTNAAGEFTSATEVISCFEYVGKKLNASLASIVTDIEAINLELGHGGTGTTGGIGERLTSVEGEVSTLKTTTQTQGGKITNIEEALETLNGTDSETGSIAHSIKTAIDALGDVAVKSDIKISEIKVKSGSTTTTLTPDSNKSVTVEIPEVQAATTSVAGVVTISGNTAIATTDTSTAAATVAAVAATRSAIAGEMGALAGTVEDAMEEAQSKVASVTGPTSGLVTVKGDKEVTIEVSDTIATKSDITTEISNATSKNAIVDNDSSTKLVTASQVATYVASEVGAIDTGVTSISVNSGAAQKGAVSITALEGVETSSHTDISPTSISINNVGNKVKLTAISAGAQVSENKLSYKQDYLATAADADTIATFRASEAKTALADTAITSQSVADNGVSVILGGTVGAPTLTGSVTPATYTSATKTWTNDTYLAKASDIATAIADAISAIDFPDVTLDGNSEGYGISFGSNTNVGAASYHYMHIATAAYTPSTETGKIGTWTEANKGYLVTGATVAAAIGDVNAKVDALHQTPQFKVVVVDGVTDLTKWQDSVTGGIQENYIYLVENIEAADGSYIEYIAYKNGETLVTERIGTTKTDLSGYVKSVTINGTTHGANVYNEGALSLGTVVTSISYNVTASGTSIEGPNAQSVYATIAGDGALSIGIASASDSVMGVSKLFSGNYWELASNLTNTAISTYTASAMFSNLEEKLDTTKVSEVVSGRYLTLAGLEVLTDGTEVTITTAQPSLEGTEQGAIRRVECNMLYHSDVYSNSFDTNAIVNGTSMFQGCTALTTFCSDLSSMTNGTSMFQGCTSLTTFIGDLSSLTSGDDMFNGCTLDAESLEILADTLPTVTRGTTIDIGASTNATEEVIATIKGKNWTVKSNGTAL